MGKVIISTSSNASITLLDLLVLRVQEICTNAINCKAPMIFNFVKMSKISRQIHEKAVFHGFENLFCLFS